jgi:hypothetical protein
MCFYELRYVDSQGDESRSSDVASRFELALHLLPWIKMTQYPGWKKGSKQAMLCMHGLTSLQYFDIRKPGLRASTSYIEVALGQSARH